MTRDQAANIIEAAIAADVLHEPIHIQLAHALDALGLLNYAAAADPTRAAQQQDQPTEWATKRQRT